MARTLVLGGGFGGLAVSHELRRLLGDAHEIELIDRRPRFLMGLRKPWAVAGIDSLEAGRRDRSRLAARGIRFLERSITRIDPARRRVELGDEVREGDHLVVALGAEPRPDLIPGLAEHGHDLYDPDRVPRLAEAVAAFSGGTILVLVAGTPYKCPPAPYETAMLLDEHLRAGGRRSRVKLEVATVQPLLLPNAGKEGSAWIGGQLAEREIPWRTGCKLQRVEPGRVVLEDGAIEFDLLIGVPPHRPPAVIAGSGLAGENPWITVDPATLRTKFERVYAIGDVTQIPLANGLPLPKAGLFAELEGLRVAADIAAALRGEPPPPPFDGRGYCFIETGRAAAGLVRGEFFATPEPKVAVTGVSAEHSTEKRKFESERLARWFGS